MTIQELLNEKREVEKKIANMAMSQEYLDLLALLLTIDNSIIERLTRKEAA